jgi:hypothetical protein
MLSCVDHQSIHVAYAKGVADARGLCDAADRCPFRCLTSGPAAAAPLGRIKAEIMPSG